jgi:hypothetical protein
MNGIKEGNLRDAQGPLYLENRRHRGPPRYRARDRIRRRPEPTARGRGHRCRSEAGRATGRSMNSTASYNERATLGVDGKERAARLLKGIVGKRLTYRRPDEDRSSKAGR